MAQREEDMYVVIALASELIGKNLATPNEARRNESIVCKYGIPAADHHTTNKRTLPILDAIASISVFQDCGQIVAVAPQTYLNAKMVHPTVAENRRGHANRNFPEDSAVSP